MHKQLFYLLTLFIFSSYPIYSQEDTIKQQLKEVEVSAPYQNSNTIAITPTQQLNAQQLSSLPALQLSDALKYFSGVVIKDYGGIGGLKTVSIRGFGS
ncbi:MAG TPA: Plug domain-containing protein, partial [Bacteroidales bacterium]|nr:Plug domain-containing protein [Bacteroidales bacterium]